MVKYRPQDLSSEEREKIAKESLIKRRDQEVADIFNVSKDTIRSCRREFGLEKKKPVFSREERQKMAKESLSYESIQEAAEHLGVTIESIRNWREQYYPEPKQATIEYLEKQYPALISRMEPKVMSMGAEEEILSTHKEDVSVVGVAEVLEAYQNTERYIEAISLGGSSYDTKGDIDGEISLKDKLNAVRKLNSNKFFKKLRGIY